MHLANQTMVCGISGGNVRSTRLILDQSSLCTEWQMDSILYVSSVNHWRALWGRILRPHGVVPESAVMDWWHLPCSWEQVMAILGVSLCSSCRSYLMLLWHIRENPQDSGNFKLIRFYVHSRNRAPLFAEGLANRDRGLHTSWPQAQGPVGQSVVHQFF